MNGVTPVLPIMIQRVLFVVHDGLENEAYCSYDVSGSACAYCNRYGLLLYSNGYTGITVDIGETTFNANFWSSSELILKRLCSTCSDTHVAVGMKDLVLLFFPSAEYKAPVHCVCPDLLQAAHGV